VNFEIFDLVGKILMIKFMCKILAVHLILKNFVLLTHSKFLLTILILLSSTPYSQAFGSHAAVTQILSHDDTHYLVFDQIGQMAASTSYIHVMLPLNISSILHQGQVIENQLNYLKNFKTANFSEIILVKQYKDMANSFHARLDRSLKQVHILNKILPQDQPRPMRYGKDLMENYIVENYGHRQEPISNLNLTRTKRAWFLAGPIAAAAAPAVVIALSATSRAIAHTVIDNSRTDNFKPLNVQEIQWQVLNKLIQQDKDAADDLLETVLEAHKVLPPQYQETFDPTRFEIPVIKFSKNNSTVKQIQATRRHIQILQGVQADVQTQTYRILGSKFTTLGNPSRLIREIMDRTKFHISTFITFFLSIQISDEKHEYTDILNDDSKDVFVPPTDEVQRHKRFAIPAIMTAVSIGARVIGTFMGLYNANEIKQITNRVIELEHTQDLLVHLTNKQQQHISQLADNLQTITSNFFSYMEFNPAILYAKLNDEIVEFESRIQRLMNSAQQLQHRRLSVDWLDDEQLMGFHQSVMMFAEDRDYTLLTKQPSDYFQLEVSYLRSGVDVIALIHVPCILSPSLLSIYKYVPFPIPLPTSSAHSPYSIQQALYPSRLHPDDPLPDLTYQSAPTSAEALYLEADADMIAIDGDSNFRLLAQSDLAGCIQRNHVFLCEQQHVLRTNLTETCLGSLYHKNSRGVRENCRFDRRPLQERVYQMSSNEYLVYSPKAFTTRISCLNGTSFTADFGQTTRLMVPNGCSIQLKTHTLRVDEKFHLPLPPQISEWKWSPMDLPADLLDRSVHLDFNLHSLQTNLSHLQESIANTDEIPKIIESHLHSKASSFGVTVWSILCITCVTPIFVGAWYLYRRHRRSTRDLRYGKDMELATLSAPPPTPALESAHLYPLPLPSYNP